MITDVRTTNSGSIISVQGVSAKGKRWIARYVPDALRFRADCDNRCGVDILAGMLDAGLVLEDVGSGRQAVRA